ncbi:MAG: hypothetical protein Kow0099_34610 [Candidatus Abyssubacteria bacterium]
MIGIGPLELIVILIVALLVIGPEKMPELARALARVMRDLRIAMDEVREQFEEFTREDLIGKREIENYYRETVDSVKKSIEAPPEELEKLGKELEDVKNAIEAEDTGSSEVSQKRQGKARQTENPEEELKAEEQRDKPDAPPAQPAP